MTTEIAEPTPPPATAAAPKNPFERIVGVLFSPGETFRDIARKPDFLVPLLVIVLLGFVGAAVIAPRIDYESLEMQQREQMRKKNPQMTEADFERMAPILRASTKVFAWLNPILGVLMLLLFAAVLHFAFRIMGGEGTFKQGFAAMTYSWMPFTLYGIIVTIVVAARGTFDPIHAATLVKSNPAFLVDMKEQPVLFSLLSSLDVFTIWTVVLLIIGFAAYSKLSYAKSAAIVIALWIVQIAAKLGIAAMNA
jgi:hypothetical protein